jgi:hypothetical protein
MVIFQTPDGNPGYNQFETVDESIGFVEKLRNEQNVLNARIFKLEELKFEFKPYFRVQLAMLNAGDASAAPAAAAPSPAPAAPAAPATPFGGAPAAPAAPVAAEAPAAPPAPQSAPVANLDSPVGRPAGGDAPVGAPLPNGNSFSGAPSEDDRGRRGLFGR